MPSLSRYMIRAAFINLWLGFGFAMAVMIWKGQPQRVSADIGGWILVHVNLLLVGWMVQLALGVAYWIFPRLAQSVNQRGRVGFASAAFGLLNGGVWAYTLGVVGQWGWLQVAAVLAQLLALVAYAYHIAPRIRPAFTKHAQA